MLDTGSAKANSMVAHSLLASSPVVRMQGHGCDAATGCPAQFSFSRREQHAHTCTVETPSACSVTPVALNPTESVDIIDVSDADHRCDEFLLMKDNAASIIDKFVARFAACPAAICIVGDEVDVAAPPKAMPRLGVSTSCQT